MNEVIESLDSIITSIPLSTMVPLPEVESDIAPSQSGIPEKPPYNLRSSVKKPWEGEAIGGLESSDVPVGPRKLRGRKSNLSKAQVKAKLDISDGKQWSLSRVLRSAQSPP